MQMYVKQEECLPLAKDLYQSFQRDFNDFMAEDHNYTQAYKDLFSAKIDEVEQQEFNNSVLTRQKQATRELYLLGDQIRLPLKKLNVRIKRAKLPTDLVTDISADIRNRNFEGVADKLQRLIQILSDNASQMQAAGMKNDIVLLLKEARVEIAEKADMQTQMMKEVSGKSDETRHLYKELEAFIRHICEDGKLMYEGTQKADEYTIKKMIGRLHKKGGKGNDENVESQK
jgi:methyl-accepting chemotaxis protein